MNPESVTLVFVARVGLCSRPVEAGEESEAKPKSEA